MSAEDVRHLAALEALRTTPRVGPVAAARLIEEYGSAEAAAEQASGPEHIARSRVAVETEIEAGIGFLAVDDPRFPVQLLGWRQSPVLLRYRGSLDAIARAGVAVVGTREPSMRGMDAAREVALAAVAESAVVFSGLARGVDSLAHLATIDSGVPTVACVATGLDTVHPRGNRELAHAVIDSGGAMVSAYGFGSAAEPWRLQERNGLIARLSVGSVAVEAYDSVGTMGEVNEALLAGRAVAIVVGDRRPTTEWKQLMDEKGVALLRDGFDPALTIRSMLAGLPLVEREEQGALFGPQEVGAPERPAPPHTCHAFGCKARVPERLLMCPSHWALVPARLKRAVWGVYVPGQEVRKDPTRDYLEVARQAIRAVAEAEGLLADYEAELIRQQSVVGSIVGRATAP